MTDPVEAIFLAVALLVVQDRRTRRCVLAQSPAEAFALLNEVDALELFQPEHTETRDRP